MTEYFIFLLGGVGLTLLLIGLWLWINARVEGSPKGHRVSSAP
jgi:hypothetical protein